MSSASALGSSAPSLPRIVSLFSGAGGLDLGFTEAGFEIVYAVDISASAIKTHRRNFPCTVSDVANLKVLGTSGLIARLETILTDGERIGIIGGPPCQGFSRANSSSKTDDPRNTLTKLYLDIVEALQHRYKVVFTIFENVLGIRDSKHQQLFHGLLERFHELKLHGRADNVCCLDFGVPQNRRRVIISTFYSQHQLHNYAFGGTAKTALTVRATIEKLPEPIYYQRYLSEADIPFHPNHWTMRPVSKRFSENSAVESGTRSFRRLSWDRPSPTVAYGHREIHVHPSGHRRLSIYEAMLLQGFPAQGFVLEGNFSSQVDQVSNAVPPPMARAIADAIINAMHV